MTKKRISLTLESALLKKVDRLVGNLDESRSGVFEHLLEMAMPFAIPKMGVILVGNSEDVLFQTHKGKLLIEHHLENLKKAGTKKIVFVGSPLTKIKNYMKEKEIQVRFVEEFGSGTAGALKKAKHLINHSFFLIYGDTYSNIDYFGLYKFHTRQKTMATIALTTWKEPQNFGVPEIVGSKIIKFKEKPAKTNSFLVSTGLFVFEPEVLDFIPEGEVSLEKQILPKLASLGQLSGYVFTSGDWVDLKHLQK